MLNVLVLGAVLALVVSAACSALGGAGAALAFALLRGWLDELSPRDRARALFALRAFPTALAVFVTAGLFLPAFLLLEPRDSAEEVGLAIALAAFLSLALLLRGPLAAASAWRSTRKQVRAWLTNGEPLELPGAGVPATLVDADFPIVAVFGSRRPRVLMARSAREAFTNRELEAVLAHEGAHASRGDNVSRLLMRGAPDVLAWTAWAARLERTWSEAVEEAADRATPRALALPLASALVKTARLAVDAAGPPAAASALYQTGSITRRVRWLLLGQRTEAAPSSRFASWLAVPGFALVVGSSALVAGSLGLLQRVHAVTEAAVSFLH